jgi:hypothetical protein
MSKIPMNWLAELWSCVNAISDETHRQIHALLTDRQKDLEKAMQEREHKGEQNRRPDPPAGREAEPSFSAFDVFDGGRGSELFMTRCEC